MGVSVAPFPPRLSVLEAVKLMKDSQLWKVVKTTKKVNAIIENTMNSSVRSMMQNDANRKTTKKKHTTMKTSRPNFGIRNLFFWRLCFFLLSLLLFLLFLLFSFFLVLRFTVFHHTARTTTANNNNGRWKSHFSQATPGFFLLCRAKDSLCIWPEEKTLTHKSLTKSYYYYALVKDAPGDQDFTILFTSTIC